jgi:hypothetical protein
MYISGKEVGWGGFRIKQNLRLCTLSICLMP